MKRESKRGCIGPLTCAGVTQRTAMHQNVWQFRLGMWTCYDLAGYDAMTSYRWVIRGNQVHLRYKRGDYQTKYISTLPDRLLAPLMQVIILNPNTIIPDFKN